jgi:5-formyltetrahydrofolate cyclo-ligase
LTESDECCKTQAVTKAELRKLYLEKQKAFTPAERAAKSGQIAEHFFETTKLPNIKTLHCFIPIEKFNEIDTMLIFERLWRELPGIQTVVPRADLATGEMRSLRFARETELVQNAWEIHEPVHHETVEAGDIDMVLVPLLACDRAGHRVGYGKGFYDRFLTGCRPDCLKIGLSYFPPIEAIDDVHEGDVRLDQVVTPDGVIKMVGR